MCNRHRFVCAALALCVRWTGKHLRSSFALISLIRSQIPTHTKTPRPTPPIRNRSVWSLPRARASDWAIKHRPKTGVKITPAARRVWHYWLSIIINDPLCYTRALECFGGCIIVVCILILSHSADARARARFETFDDRRGARSLICATTQANTKKKHMAFLRYNNRSRSARLAMPLGGAVWSHADWHANANGEQRLRHFIGYPRPPCLIKCHTYVWRAWPARLDFRSLVTVRSAAVACVEPHAKYFLEIDEPFAGIV